MKKIYELYIDIFFAVNTMLNFLVIVLVRQILQYQSTVMKMAAAAAAGAFILSFYIVAGAGRFMWLRIVFFLSAYIVMSRIAFVRCRGRARIRAAISLYAMSIFVNGMWNWLGADVLGVWQLGIGIVLVYGMIRLIERVFRQLHGKEEEMCEVCIGYHGSMIRLKGLWDTGNCLKSPYHGRGISIVSYDCMKIYMPEALRACMESGGDIKEHPEGERLFYVPYRTIDRPGGMLPVIEAQWMWIQKDQMTKEYQKPLLGLSMVPVGEKNRFQIILTTQG